MLGQDGRNLGFDLLELLVRVVVGQGIEDVVDPGEKFARSLESFNRVGESRGLGARGYGLDLLLLSGYAFLKGGHVVALFDLGEWRRPERRRPFPEKWIRLGRSDRLRLLFFGAREKPQYQDECNTQIK